MLRARSEFFREEIMKEVQATTFLKIDEVLETRPSTSRPGETDLKVKYSEFVPQDDVRRVELFKNLSITRMPAEIKKEPGNFPGGRFRPGGGPPGGGGNFRGGPLP